MNSELAKKELEMISSNWNKKGLRKIPWPEDFCDSEVCEVRYPNVQQVNVA